jgi:propanol-preferring alcohol dehydrogenase
LAKEVPAHTLIDAAFAGSSETSMKAVRLVQVGKPLEQADVALPEIGPADVLVLVAACGICHSDAHYRAGVSPIDSLPVTLGHEVAGRVESVGEEVTHVLPGDHVYVHYLVSCGCCGFCSAGNEQFCTKAQMIGKHRDGGYAEYIKIPGRNVFALPDEISFEQGAVMMCSSATALHALNKARLKRGDSVAIFGFGGLGFSALQLSRAFGCQEIYVVEVNPAKLASIVELGAVAIDATAGDPAQQIREATRGNGVDVSLELVGSALTMGQAVRCLSILGRAAIVGLTTESMALLPYTELINKEAEIIGVSDHLAAELSLLMQLAHDGKLGFPSGTLRSIGLDAMEINAALTALDNSIDHIRTIIVPGT